MSFKWFSNFISDECGQGMTKYALILVLAALVIVAVLTLMSGTVTDLFGVNTINEYVTTPAKA